MHSSLNNGISLDKYNRIWIAETLNRRVSVYKIEQLNSSNHLQRQLKHLKTIYIGYLVDNINYIKKEDMFYFGYTGRTHEFLKLKSTMHSSDDA